MTLTHLLNSIVSLAIFNNIFIDGGPLFMSLILICLLMSLGFSINGFVQSKKSIEKAYKMLNLAVDMNLLGLVLGFLGSVLGLITAFDSVEAMGDPDPSIFAGGLKVSLLTATFGLFSFVIARIGILLLRSYLKPESKTE